MSLRVLKLGWEFPPYSYGGLGVACEGLVKGLTQAGVQVLLVLPKQVSLDNPKCTAIATQTDEGITTTSIDALIQPYMNAYAYRDYYQRYAQNHHLYGPTLFAEIERYAQVVSDLVRSESFDIIHAHDWMSFKAGVLAKKITGKPLVVHVHATEFDRTGGNSVHQTVYDIERWGMHEADKVIAVSNFAKNTIVQHYGIDPDKIAVVYNAIEQREHPRYPIHKTNPIVLFLGRLTLQKGPDYFVQAAKKIIPMRPDITFIVAGSGDMEHGLMDDVAGSGLGGNILFTGYLSKPDVVRAYQMADVYVMPSVSEPFGLTALEAMQQGTPVIISKQSGVAEVVSHVLKVDFWDVNEIITKVLSVVDNPDLKHELGANGRQEVKKFNWHNAAQACINVYKECLSQ